MYRHPMLSVKEAAALLGCDERWVRERLNQGQLKGEKKTIGLKEKWFVYKGEVDAALARKGVFPSAVAEQTSFEPIVESDAVDAESSVAGNEEEPAGREWLGMEREAIRVLAEEMVKPLVETIKQQSAALTEKDKIIEDQGRQLRLLPDLQKREEETRKVSELKALEVEALHKQIGAMEEEAGQVRLVEAEKEAETVAIKQELATLRSKLERMEQPWWKRWFNSES